MKYFYFLCATLVVGLLTALVALDQKRDPIGSVKKSITSFAIFSKSDGCETKWFNNPLLSSTLDIFRKDGVVCAYSGEIKKDQCNQAVYKNASIATYVDGHLECHEQFSEKLLRTIKIQESVKPFDCEKEWLGRKFIGVGQASEAGSLMCYYDGEIDRSQCRVLEQSVEYPIPTVAMVIDTPHIPTECRVKTSNGYWRSVHLIK